MEMIERNILFRKLGAFAVVFASMWAFASCSDDVDEQFTTSEELTIVQFLNQNDSIYSDWVKVIEKSDIEGSLNAYGTYTHFAPTNKAMGKFLQELGISSVDDMEKDLAKLVARYHTLATSYPTTAFEHGVLADTTASGDRLSTSFGEGGLRSIMVNDQSKIVGRDVECSNGFVHTLDEVLRPVTKSLYDVIKANPDLGIFAQALAETGLSDTLTKITAGSRKMYATVLVESDETFKKAGINSFDELKARYSDTPNMKDKANGLYKFMHYHCVSGSVYSSDFISNLYPTFNDALINVRITNEIRINPLVGEDDVETSNGLNMDKVNIPAKNGVYHYLNDVMPFYQPDPVEYVFDLQGIRDMQPFRKPSNHRNVYFPKDLPSLDIQGSFDWFVYEANRGGYRGRDFFWIVSSGCSIEVETDPVIAGKYEVFISYGKAGDGTIMKMYVDGVPQSTYIDCHGGGYEEKSLGVFTFDETKKHKFKAEVIITPGRTVTQWDAVIFKPVKD
ncbi:hypothetical protein FUAX_43980 (plasmid) [Fulvitalea axinellae]|uniref:FAS1 domain-containing protein n=1 Tax=Fulvitalea axinellae TaxID=1182444 RepID=A0AAU9DFP9_9BACT|nr:hypothetical protein FUAX_43980 [Fulvitalea axinellae]